MLNTPLPHPTHVLGPFLLLRSHVVAPLQPDPRPPFSSSTASMAIGDGGESWSIRGRANVTCHHEVLD